LLKSAMEMGSNGEFSTLLKRRARAHEIGEEGSAGARRIAPGLAKARNCVASLTAQPAPGVQARGPGWGV